MSLLAAITIVVALAGADLRRDLGFAGLEADGVRFSSQPALGGPGQVFEAVLPPGAGEARVRVVRATGSAQAGWALNEDTAFAIPAARYRRLAEGFDAAFEAPVDPLVVCADGSGLLAERNRGGEAVSMADSCGGLPIAGLGALVRDLIEEQRKAPQ